MTLDYWQIKEVKIELDENSMLVSNSEFVYNFASMSSAADFLTEKNREPRYVNGVTIYYSLPYPAYLIIDSSDVSKEMAYIKGKII